jgi:GntR family transcriptional repressor for pyruvate dehydrogenase complex
VNEVSSTSLQRAGVGEQIFSILKSKIAAGEWKKNGKIPSETELASQFSVSRMTVHNVIQRLCTMGLLETRPGDGTYVKEFRLAEYFKEAIELLDNNKSMQDIREFRDAFERDYLILACERRTEKDIEDLEFIYHKMAELSLTDDFDAFFDVDMEFHHRICQMTQNDVYIMVESVLRDLLYAQLKDNTKRFAKMKSASMSKEDDNYVLKVLTAEHIDFIEALKKKDYRIAADMLTGYIKIYKDMD